MSPPSPILLRVCGLDGSTHEHLGPGSKLQIGSHPSCNLVLPGRGVAEYHCVIEATRSGPVLRDRGSRSGTFVNSERLTEPRTLVVGDRIYIGEYQLELLPAPSIAAPPPAPVVPRHASRPPHTSVATLVLGLTALGLGLGTLWLAGQIDPPTSAPEAPVPPDPTTTIAAPADAAPPGPPPRRVHVLHEVIPGETIADIATRYGVSQSRLIADHDLDPDLPPPPHSVLRIEAVDPPLPRLRLRHPVERGDSWTSLGERFGVDVELLRRFNPTLSGELTPGTELVVWVDPQIEPRRDEAVRLRFPVAPDARSIDAPSAGRLERGLQLPASDNYERVNPRLQYGSSHTIEHLRLGIARFRQLYKYEGVLVVSDLSKPAGGPAKPHSSHQSGRDVDIWLPALKGTYQRRHLAADRKPRNAEINWFAAWGLVESLLSTGEVKYIFLDRSLLPRLYQAGERMGASAEQLRRIEWQPPSAPDVPSAPVRHGANHVGHIHVRFKCGPADDRCIDRAVVEDP